MLKWYVYFFSDRLTLSHISVWISTLFYVCTRSAAGVRANARVGFPRAALLLSFSVFSFFFRAQNDLVSVFNKNHPLTLTGCVWSLCV
jgi:hypothetical protein